jgi:hypothetical protein
MQTWNLLDQHKLWLRREFRTYQDSNTELCHMFACNSSMMSESNFNQQNAMLLQKMDDIRNHNIQNDNKMYLCELTLSLTELIQLNHIM